MSATTTSQDYLLAVSVGPVQGFISAARRTRDLWFGSFVLSEVARAVAVCMLECGGELIFPVVDSRTAEGLPDSSGPGSQPSVANKLLAMLPAAAVREDPALVARRCRDAARARWLEFADEAHRQADALGLAIREDLWGEQVDDVIQVYSAWVPVAGDGDYKQAYRRLEAVLSGRKLTRDFRPATGRPGVPKSVLDGARESVINPQSVPARVLRRCGLKRGEHLDAVGVIKRLGGGSQRFPPVCRVAAQPWLQTLQSYRPEVLKELSGCFARLAGEGYVSRCSWPPLERDGGLADELFPFEAEPLFAGRRADLMREITADGSDPGPLRRVAELVGPNEPSPYLAVLVGDGDHMGPTLSSLGSAQDHRRCSRALAGFAGRTEGAEGAKGIVRKYGGCLVYSGGDDVLALLPVDTVLDAARALRDLFRNTVSRAIGEGCQAPTFSAGVGIGHFQEPLGELLERARGAGKHAKKGSVWTPDGRSEPSGGEPGRNAVAVWAQARAGGEPVRFWARWDDLSLVKTWVEALLAGHMPARTAYELGQLALRYGLGPTRPSPLPDSLTAAFEADLRRVLRRREAAHGGELSPQVVEGLVELCRRPGGIARAASGLRLALIIAEARRAAQGVRNRRG